MRTTFLKALKGLVILIATTALNSCSKENREIDFTTAYHQALADESFNDVTNIADEASTTGSVSHKTDDTNSLTAGCAVVTRDTVSMPHITTIDFGTGCTGADGRTRKGQIIVTYDGKYRDPGTTITITFNNYFVNDHQITGTKTIHNDGVNANGHLSYSIDVNGQMILADNAGTITWTSQRIREWVSGESTPNCDDDQYSITGTVLGVAANGDQFSVEVVTPLIRNLALGCRRHFVSGEVLLKQSGKPDRLLNYGTGDCDNLATVTVNGNTYNIVLKP